MSQRAIRRGGHCRADQPQVPSAQGQEHLQGLLRGNAGLGCCPTVLVEGLKCRRILGQRLAQPKCKGQLAVGEVAEYLRRAPFAGRGRCGSAIRTDRCERCSWSRGADWLGLVRKKRGAWVYQNRPFLYENVQEQG